MQQNWNSNFKNNINDTVYVDQYGHKQMRPNNTSVTYGTSISSNEQISSVSSVDVNYEMGKVQVVLNFDINDFNPYDRYEQFKNKLNIAAIHIEQQVTAQLNHIKINETGRTNVMSFWLFVLICCLQSARPGIRDFFFLRVLTLLKYITQAHAYSSYIHAPISKENAKKKQYQYQSTYINTSTTSTTATPENKQHTKKISMILFDNSTINNKPQTEVC